MLFRVIIISLLGFVHLFAVEIKNGPMVGYAEMREASIWVQLDETAMVQARYWAMGDDSQKKETTPVAVSGESAFTATLIATEVLPGTTYLYEILVNGEIVTVPYATAFTTTPDHEERRPPPDFSVAVISGHYVNEELFNPPFRTPGGGYEVFEAILEKSPKMVFWAGNTASIRTADAWSLSGYQQRYSSARSQEQMKPLLAQVPQYGTWGHNDYALKPEQGSRYWMRENAQSAFRSFWPNQQRMSVSGIDGMISMARYSDVVFYLLDANSFRTEDGLFGEVQLDWLLHQLTISEARFKVIISGVPILHPNEEMPQNWAAFSKERDRFLKHLEDQKISGLFFVSGGLSHTELTRAVRAGAPPVFDLTVAPVTDRPEESTDQINYFRVPQTSVFERNFATLTFEGAENARKLRITVYNSRGSERWSKTLTAEEMSF